MRQVIRNMWFHLEMNWPPGSKICVHHESFWLLDVIKLVVVVLGILAVDERRMYFMLSMIIHLGMSEICLVLSLMEK